MTTIIGLTGYTGCGKSALGDLLERKNRGVKHYGMSEALLRRFLIARPSILPGFPITSVDELHELKRKHPALREAIQDFGMAFRQIETDIWVKAVLFDIYNDKRTDYAIVSGIRFENEREMCDHVVGICRPGYGPVNGHASETGTAACLEAADITINNTGTLQELYETFENHFPGVSV